MSAGFRTRHELRLGDARELPGVEPGSVRLVVTSPPYPLVALWDEDFRAMSPGAARALEREDGPAAFEAMHRELDRVWAACARALAPGGIACINVGDATRSLGGRFRLYSNHARILAAFQRLGFDVLPDLLWRKPNNSPTKYLGSGVLPPNAYVTYEHEYVLVFRKGGPRRFAGAERERRRHSALFWEERNRYFSDIWDFAGSRQARRGPGRARSGAFPLELPLRLVRMFSLYGDTVLDPFAGTGTTALAALAAGRSSIGLDWHAELLEEAALRLEGGLEQGRRLARERIEAHRAFVAARPKPPRHGHPLYGPVVTRQETALRSYAPLRLAWRRRGPPSWLLEAEYQEFPTAGSPGPGA